MVRKRATWLVILFVGEMFTATAMGFFEQQIERAVVLALFVPLIISSGGNSGSQAATLIIRALALGEVRLADWWRDHAPGDPGRAALGLDPGLDRLRAESPPGTPSRTFTVPTGSGSRLTVSLSLDRRRLVGNLDRLDAARSCSDGCGFDPATSSAPFVATLVDVTGLIIYFLRGQRHPRSLKRRPNQLFDWPISRMPA